MANRTPVIDVQVHAYMRNTPDRPWVGYLQGPDEVTGDQMVVAMDAVGVDGALLVSPYSMYGYDASYALEVYEQHPGKFALIRPFDPESESIDEEMAEWTGTPGVVGARIMLARMDFGADHPGLNQIMAAGGRAGVPVNVMASEKLDIPARAGREQSRHRDRDRPCGPGPAVGASGAARRLGRSRRRAIAGGAGQCCHQDLWGVHAGS